MSTANEPATATAEEVTGRAVNKRYEGLLTVRTRAIRGKGAWYWAHLEPILLHSEAGLPRAVKLRCSLCSAVFSASNPSRTASEHLKRGTCPNFASLSHPPHASRKRSSPSFQACPLALVDPAAAHGGSDPVYSSSSTPPQHFVLSGGREDLGALALLEDSVKKLKSPMASPPGPALSRAQADSAIALFSDWFYDSCGSVSFSSLDHPKFRSFLRQVGLPPVSSLELAGARLDARYDEARADSEARISDALFYQLTSDGWKSPSPDALVGIAVNLPNGTTVFRRAVLAGGRAPPKYAEEILWDAVTEISGGGGVHRCVGILADRFKSTALRRLESQNQWMVNLYCQLQGVRSLVNDFVKDIPLFTAVVENCRKLANLFNTNTQARNIFQKHNLQELDSFTLLRAAPSADAASIFHMLDDIVASARPIQLAVHDDSYKLDEIGEMARGMGFWSDLEAAHTLMKTVDGVVGEMEAERPLVGQCLPLWDELRSKVKAWCSKYGVDEGPLRKAVERRFEKNYHPAWAAAFVLDPINLVKDASGKYVPPYKYLTAEQEKDVDRLITRLASREEAHIALMELMKWRSEGLDPLYARAVQVRRPDPASGKMRVANPQAGRLVWETVLSEGFGSLARVAVRLIFLRATACGLRCGPELRRWAGRHGRSRAGMERSQKMVFVAAHSRLERRDFSSEEGRDAELFANGDDDSLNEGFVDSSAV